VSLLENPLLHGLIFQEIISGVALAGSNSGSMVQALLNLETVNPSAELTLSPKQLGVSSLGLAGGVQSLGRGALRL
jgi:hypothetical protein